MPNVISSDSRRCSFKKHGLDCSVACEECKGSICIIMNVNRKSYVYSVNSCWHKDSLWHIPRQQKCNEKCLMERYFVSCARTRRCCQHRNLTTLTKRVASLKMPSYVNFNCTWMLSVLAYMPNVISSEFVIGYDGEFRNNTLVPINLLDGATR